MKKNVVEMWPWEWTFENEKQALYGETQYSYDFSVHRNRIAVLSPLCITIYKIQQVLQL